MGVEFPREMESLELNTPSKSTKVSFIAKNE